MRSHRTHLLLFLLLAISLVSVLTVNTIGASVASAAPSDGVNLVKANVLWEKTYGGTGDDRAYYATAAGNSFLVVGSSTSFEQGKTLGWVLQLDDDGNALWNRTYPQEAGSEFRYALSLSDGFLLVGNVFTPSGDVNGYVVRTDSQGNPIWNITIGGDKVDKLFSAAQTQDGFLLTGLTNSFGAGDSDVWIIKVDNGGNVVWNKTFGWSMDDAGRAITMTEDNCYVIAGYTNSTGSGDYDFLLVKIDASGSFLWNRTYGGAQSEKAYAIASAQGGCVVAGDTRSKGAGDSDAWTIKVDLNGNLLWDNAVGGKDFDQATCVTASADGGFLFGGFTFSFGNGKRDFWLFKVDASGNVLWSTTVGRSGFEEAYAVLETAENEFVMAGWTNSIGQGHYDFYVVKLSVENGADWLSGYMLVAFALVAVGIALLASLFLIRRRVSRKMSEPEVSRTLTRNVCSVWL